MNCKFLDFDYKIAMSALLRKKQREFWCKKHKKKADPNICFTCPNRRDK